MAVGTLRPCRRGPAPGSFSPEGGAALTPIAHFARQPADTTLADGPARVAPVLGRVPMAAICLMSGIGKAAAPAGASDYIGAAGLPRPQAAVAVAVLVEIGGGPLQVAGFGAGAFSLDARRGRA